MIEKHLKRTQKWSIIEQFSMQESSVDRFQVNTSTQHCLKIKSFKMFLPKLGKQYFELLLMTSPMWIELDNMFSGIAFEKENRFSS